MLDVLEGALVPTVAAVHGGGLELALTCDMIVPAHTASIGQAEVTVGPPPLLGGTQRLVSRAGLARAKAIVMLGRRHTSQAFERWESSISSCPRVINHDPTMLADGIEPDTRDRSRVERARLGRLRRLARGPAGCLRER